MDKILIQSGGQPMFLGDVDFAQQSTRNIFKGVSQALALGSAGNCILQGCTVKLLGGTDYTWTAGYMAINGEIYPVVAGNLTTQNPVYWVVRRTKTEIRTFEDKSNKPVWETSYVTITDAVTTEDVYVQVNSMKLYTDLLSERLFAYTEIPIPVTVLEFFGISVNMVVRQYAAFRKIIITITELDSYKVQPLNIYFEFGAEYYPLVEDVVMAGCRNQNHFLLDFTVAKQTAVGNLLHLNDKLPKWFQKITFRITV